MGRLRSDTGAHTQRLLLDVATGVLDAERQSRFRFRQCPFARYGGASRRVFVYAATGTINTSDALEEDIAAPIQRGGTPRRAPHHHRRWHVPVALCDRQARARRKARLHAGITAQDVAAAFQGPKGSIPRAMACSALTAWRMARRHGRGWACAMTSCSRWRWRRWPRKRLPHAALEAVRQDTGPGSVRNTGSRAGCAAAALRCRQAPSPSCRQRVPETSQPLASCRSGWLSLATGARCGWSPAQGQCRRQGRRDAALTPKFSGSPLASAK